MRIASHLFLIGVASLAVLSGCAQSGQTPTQTTKSSSGDGTSTAKWVMPKPPIKEMQNGFGLADAASNSTASSAEKSTATTGSTSIPSGAIAAQGGGYWHNPVSEVGNVPSGYMQYYNSAGTATDWFGKPGSGSSANTFTMAKGNLSSYQGPDLSQQFVAQKSTAGWSSGQILDASGKPYTYSSGGNTIASSGYTVGSNGQPIYNWNAVPANSVQKPQVFQTSGYDINSGLANGMTYMNASGQPVSYVAPTGVQGVSPLNPAAQSAQLFSGFISQLFK